MAEIGTALRNLTRETAAGRCEYCLTPEEFSLTTYEIDHIIALKHGGKTSQDNLAFCCALCNRHKGTDIASIDPATGNVVPLFHPRRDRWPNDFEIRDGEIVPLTVVGRVTALLLQLNTPRRIRERRLLFKP